MGLSPCLWKKIVVLILSLLLSKLSSGAFGLPSLEMFWKTPEGAAGWLDCVKGSLEMEKCEFSFQENMLLRDLGPD